MGKILLRIVIPVLWVAFVNACKPVRPPSPALTPTPPATPVPLLATPTTSPTQPPTETPLVYPGWTTFPAIRSIKDMLFDRQGNLWAVGPEGVVLLQTGGTLRRFITQDGLPSNDLLSVGLDTDGAVWVGSRGAGVSRFDGTGWQTFANAEGLGDNQVLSIATYLGYEGILAGTPNGLSVYNGSWYNYSGSGYLPDDEVRDIVVSPGGAIWVGTPKGVTLFGPSETFTSADGLASDEVYAIAIAPDCSLWLGTGGGVSHAEGETWTSYTTADGLVDDQVSETAITLDGAVWFGTPSGVSRFDGQNWTTYTTAEGLADNTVLSVAVAPDDTLWFGTAGGLSHFDPDLIDSSRKPVISPEDIPGNTSALHIVYLKDGNLWKWEAGNQSQLTRNGRVSSLKLSGDGRKVAFTRLNEGIENELWVIDLDGSNERRLVSPQDLDALGKITEDEQTRSDNLRVVIFHYEWIPGKDILAYDTRRHLEEAGSMYHDDLNLVDAKSGERTTLLPPGRGGSFLFSPDGSQVSIITPNQLSIMNTDGSHWRGNLLEYPGVLTYSEAAYYPHPIWSADSQYLRLALPPRDPLATSPEPTTLWHIPTDGSPATQLGSIFPAHILALAVAFSPDLIRLAYLTEVGEPAENQNALHIANFDGTEDITIQTGMGLRFHSWSPDGQHFIYGFGNPVVWYLGGFEDEPALLPFQLEELVWVNNEAFLSVEDLGCALELRLTSLNGESLVIDRMWQPPVSFDFTFGENIPYEP